MEKPCIKRTNRSRRVAFAGAIAFCFGPASIFLSALYSESLYAFGTFWGLRVLFDSAGQYNELLRSGLILSITCGARSTGFLNAIFFFVFFLHFFRIRLIRSWNFSKALEMLFVIFLSIFLMVAPLLIYQYWSFLRYCQDPEMIKESPWCLSLVPDIYNYVQKKYWGVGLFAYYKLSQIPNFLLALPMLILSFFSIGVFLWFHLIRMYHVIQRERRGRKKETTEESSEKTKNTKTFFSTKVIPFVAHFSILLVISLTVLHVQVVTRFMSASPALYWFVGWLLVDRSDRSPLHPLEKPLVNSVWFSLLGRLVPLYFLSYFIIGTALFVNFYPWT